MCLDDISAWPFFGKQIFGTRRYWSNRCYRIHMYLVNILTVNYLEIWTTSSWDNFKMIWQKKMGTCMLKSKNDEATFQGKCHPCLSKRPFSAFKSSSTLFPPFSPKRLHTPWTVLTRRLKLFHPPSSNNKENQNENSKHTQCSTSCANRNRNNCTGRRTTVTNAHCLTYPSWYIYSWSAWLSSCLFLK